MKLLNMYKQYKNKKRVKEIKQKVLNDPLSKEFCRLKGITMKEFLEDIEKTESEEKE